MLEKGTSGLMSGEGKRAAASRPRTALFLDSTCALTAQIISGGRNSNRTGPTLFLPRGKSYRGEHERPKPLIACERGARGPCSRTAARMQQ